jgi:uncharacterized membrane protein YkvA (DUF1232 family)
MTGAFDRVRAALPTEIAGRVRPSDGSASVTSLRALVLEHAAALQASAVDHDVDLETAARLTSACLALLDEAVRRADITPLVALACEYFVSQDDAEGDLDSFIGLEDDVLVLNAVAREVGRADVALAVG